MIRVRIEGMDRILKGLNPGMAPRLQAASIALGMEIKRRMAVYPSLVKWNAVYGRSLRWKSAKQRRFYFAMRRQRGLPPAYRRQTDRMSQRLKMKWTVVKYQALGAKVANSATYAPYVQCWQAQQPFHKDAGWVTDKQIAEQVQKDGTAKRIYEDVLVKIATGE